MPWTRGVQWTICRLSVYYWPLHRTWRTWFPCLWRWDIHNNGQCWRCGHWLSALQTFPFPIQAPFWWWKDASGNPVYIGVKHRTRYGSHPFDWRVFQEDSTENLVVHVPVQMFHQLPVGESGVCLQDHKDDLCGRTEYVPAAQTLFRQTCGFCHTLKQKQRMKPAKPTLMKTLAVFFQNIKFCKAQSRVNFWNFCYLSHILVGEFPLFGPSNLVFGGIPRRYKKPTNPQHIVY